MWPTDISYNNNYSVWPRKHFHLLNVKSVSLVCVCLWLMELKYHPRPSWCTEEAIHSLSSCRRQPVVINNYNSGRAGVSGWCDYSRAASQSARVANNQIFIIEGDRQHLSIYLYFGTEEETWVGQKPVARLHFSTDYSALLPKSFQLISICGHISFYSPLSVDLIHSTIRVNACRDGQLEDTL